MTSIGPTRVYLSALSLLFIHGALAGNLVAAPTVAPHWRDAAWTATLCNDVVEARLQAGLLYQLRDIQTGMALVAIPPAALPSTQPLLGPRSVDLDGARVSQSLTADFVEVVYDWPDGTQWRLCWIMAPGRGELILRAEASFPAPVEELRILIPGGNIKDYTLVYMHGYGTAYTANAPWTGGFLGDPQTAPSPMTHPHAIVALFEGQDSGWFVEGREERVGPANLMLSGRGDTVNLGFTRRFPLGSATPKMYEIRIRPYHGDWMAAVDPYVQWLEEGAGFLALDNLPPEQAWVNNLKTQAYISVGNYQGLDELAQRVNPQETFVGRQAEFRYHGFDVGYPDYRITEPARAWLRYARELGFHVGMHFNIQSVSAMFPELFDELRPGFRVIGQDDQGNDIYESIQDGANIRVSVALKAWRDLLVERITEAVEAGIDVIYLDEAMSPGGQFVVDGMDGFEGTFAIMQQILEKWPHVAIETEQFNPLTAKYGKLALSQMPLGHPFSGYIYRRFVKVVPEGVMYSPTEAALMDAFACWGFMLPGADTQREDSWMEIAEAFHEYHLRPAPELPRKRFTRFASHWTHGLTPVCDEPIPAAGQKLFGFRGANGVIAYLERRPTKRGLVIYAPGAEPRWVGVRHGGIRTYEGPGLPVYFGFREKIRDWLIYDDGRLLGLDPRETYWFDAGLQPKPERFHLFQVPDNFAGVSTMEMRTAAQEVGDNDVYFCLRFAAQGQIGAFVPEGYLAYLNGQELEVDPQTRQAFAYVNAGETGPAGLGYHIQLGEANDAAAAPTLTGPAYLIAFRKTDVDLVGPWINLPWYGSRDSLKWITGDGDRGFLMAVGAIGRFVGRIPEAAEVSITGTYQMHDTIGGGGVPGDGVIRINGREILRVPHGGRPFKPQPFNVDISAYAGRYVVVEFTPDAGVRGHSAQWGYPRFIFE